MLKFYLGEGAHILLVDGAAIDSGEIYKIDNCCLPDVLHVGGGIYDAIVFPQMPPKGILRGAIEKVYWGGYIIAFGVEKVVREAGYQVVTGNPGPLVLRRQPLPEEWTEAYFMEFPTGGEEWDCKMKTMHPRYPQKFLAIDAKWKGTTVIEYGCGRGEMTRLIALSGVKRVYAVDRAPAAISLAAKFCSDLDNVALVCDDALQWEAPQKADIVIALDFVEHIEEKDLPRLFQRIRKNLNIGGLVHIVTPLGPDAVRNHKWAPSPSNLREKMEGAGFKYRRHVRPKDSRKFLAEFTNESS